MRDPYDLAAGARLAELRAGLRPVAALGACPYTGRRPCAVQAQVAASRGFGRGEVWVPLSRPRGLTGPNSEV